MKSRTLAIFGIGTYILAVLSSATDIEGNSTAPTLLLAISGIATLIFYILATIRLWKIQKLAPILLICSAVILVVLPAIEGIKPIFQNIASIFSTIVFIWVICLLWAIGKYEIRVAKLQKDSRLTNGETHAIQEYLKKGDHEAATQVIANAQERHRIAFKEMTGTDAKNIIAVIGEDVSWSDVVNHAFRVLEFDRTSTTIDPDGQVKAKSSFEPYGYLLVETPILNNLARLPIIHRDDFLLVANVFDEPKLADLIEDGELLVTYAPKRLLPKGLSGSPHHVLHYVITQRGTIDAYYSKNNSMYMGQPDPQKLFGPFVYRGDIKIQINVNPEF
ncbi:MAG: hypothetical protein PHR28_13600 [candidate division Zixibacteria bacterium]|nr:hypothetical protein [candidate division Zixibacteria bacterium]